jgi:tRNA (mo5U34)-methyltransferase
MASILPHADRDGLPALIADHEWYHTIELAPGISTPGWFDTRTLPDQLPFPPSMHGMRCLDIGTFDGFWAFEMERRGADEVVAIDILDPAGWDWPWGSDVEVRNQLDRRKRGGSGFELAARERGSQVVRRELSIYDLDPTQIGQFDFVYCGSILLHLRDPIGALMRVRSVTRAHLLAVDAIDLVSSILPQRRPAAYLDGVGRPWWWRPNEAGLVRMVEAAGFELEQPPQRIRMPPGPGHPRHSLRDRAGRSALLNRTGRELAFAARFGDPHCALLARPRTAAAG